MEAGTSSQAFAVVRQAEEQQQVEDSQAVVDAKEDALGESTESLDTGMAPKHLQADSEQTEMDERKCEGRLDGANKQEDEEVAVPIEQQLLRARQELAIHKHRAEDGAQKLKALEESYERRTRAHDPVPSACLLTKSLTRALFLSLPCPSPNKSSGVQSSWRRCRRSATC